MLDVEDEATAALAQGFTLEVSSPGLDRPLRGEADYRRFAGRLAKVVTREPVGGQSHFSGRLVRRGRRARGDDRGAAHAPRAIALVSRARLDVEF